MKTTSSATELLNNIFTTVQRAGPVFTGNATLNTDGEGYHFTLQLVPGAFNKNEVGLKAQKALGGFLRAYLRDNGWRIKAASFKRSYVELFVAASKAASSSSQKRRAIL